MCIMENLCSTLQDIRVVMVEAGDSLLFDDSFVLGSAASCYIAGSSVVFPNGLLFHYRRRTWTANDLLPDQSLQSAT
jgi:hypothetical protein